MNKKGLNPYATPFLPAALNKNLECEERSLFMTFSNGSPLKNEEISDFFNRVYGKYCLEHVYVHEQYSKNPKFGKLVFKNIMMPIIILGDREVVKVCINTKPLWLKKYVPRTQRRRLRN